MQRLASLLVAALAALAAQGAIAQVLIQPVVVEFGPRQRTVVVNVSMGERGQAPMRLQAQVLRWKQDVNGQPVTEAASEIMVSPAIAELRPGQRQLFRLALRDARPMPVEASFRLVLEDVAEPVDALGQPRGGLNIRMRYDLPVLIGPAAAPVQAFEWKTCPPDAATAPAGIQPRNVQSLVCLRVANAGNRRAKIQSVVLEGDTWRHDQMLAEAALVLAGAERELRIPLPPGQGGPLARVQVRTPQGQVLQASPRS